MGKVILSSTNHVIWAVQRYLPGNPMLDQHCQIRRINKTCFDYVTQVKFASMVRKTRAQGALPSYQGTPSGHTKHPGFTTSVIIPGTGSTGILQPLPNNILALTLHLYLLFGTTEDKTLCKMHQVRALTELLSGPHHCRIMARLISLCSWLGMKKIYSVFKGLGFLLFFNTHESRLSWTTSRKKKDCVKLFKFSASSKHNAYWPHFIF